MKRSLTKLFLLGFMLAFGSILTSNNLFAQDIPACPQGWNSGFHILGDFVIDQEHTCYITLFYCWRDNNGQREVIIRGVDIMDKSCLIGININNPAFWTRMTAALLKYQESLPTGYPEKLNPGPCEPFIGGTIVIEVSKKACWKYVNGASNVVMMGCEEEQADCIEEYAMCWDYSTQAPVLHITKLTQTPVNMGCNVPVGYNPNIPVSECWANCND